MSINAAIFVSREHPKCHWAGPFSELVNLVKYTG